MLVNPGLVRISVMPQTRALANAMTTPPSAARFALINQTIRALFGAGLWSKLDVLYMLAAHDEQAGRLNWKAPGTFTLTANNSPTFTVDRGFAGDGATSDLSSTYNASTFGGRFTLDSAVLGAYEQLIETASGGFLMSMGTSRINANAALTMQSVRVNDASASLNAGTIAVGHYAARRASSAGREAWVNGVLAAGPDAVASTTIGSSFRILSLGGSSNWSSARVAYAYAGGGFSVADMLAFNGILLSYLQGVGAA